MSRRFSKIYFEITNQCNAACSFCPGTTREKHFVSMKEFDCVLSKLAGRADFLYFHLMGEPLLHPDICAFAEKASRQGFKVMITTNGLLADTRGRELVDTGKVFKLSISLHSFEANRYGIALEDYLKSCFSLAERASERGTLTALRLWNLGSAEDGTESNLFNEKVIVAAKEYFGDVWIKNRSGFCIGKGIYLEWGEHFDWPGYAKINEGKQFCHALRLQMGILCDGTVVPCCLDSEGEIALGNIFDSDIDEYFPGNGRCVCIMVFTAGFASEDICKRCGFARRFSAT